MIHPRPMYTRTSRPGQREDGALVLLKLPATPQGRSLNDPEVLEVTVLVLI